MPTSSESGLPSQPDPLQEITWRVWRELPMRDLVRPRKLGRLIRSKPYSLLSFRRLSMLYDLSIQIERQEIVGDIVECGVWNGGSAGVLARGVTGKRQRYLWLLDSWQGLPEPGPMDVSFKNEPGVKGSVHGSEVRLNELLFDKIGLDRMRVHIIKGWYQDTLPHVVPKIPSIALLHIDCDWYQSVKQCLDSFYNRVSPGGFVVLDDYGYWLGSKLATHEFMSDNSLSIELIPIDRSAVYFQKPFLK